MAIHKPKYLKEKYKTYEGAAKRRGFENGLAKFKFENGYKAKHYRYVVMPVDGIFRVLRLDPDDYTSATPSPT